MKIIALADMHGDTGRIGEMGAELASVDAVLLPGDLTNFGEAFTPPSLLSVAHADVLSATAQWSPHPYHRG